MKTPKPLLFICFFYVLAACQSETVSDHELESTGSIRPWSENPAYWEFKGEPVLLLGATDDDNLFQLGNLKSHLDSLHAVGGNYIRNTMSDRDPGNLRAFARDKQGKYDLKTWNDAYWGRMDSMLFWTAQRDIIVQIEIWDRFDHSRQQWLSDPYHPANNSNYTYEEVKLDSLYPNHPGANEQPFFYTVPALDDNPKLLNYQESFVRKLLSHTLAYDHVLYCIDNETKGEDEWALYWAEFVKKEAGDKEIMITQMWDDWDITSDMHRRTLDRPEIYSYIDMSQNSHNTGQQNWDNARFIFDYLQANPRPVNSTKIYGSRTSPWTNRGINEQHAVETFYRNIIGGFASSRFHRPPAGLGLSAPSILAISSLRKVEERVKLWEVDARMDLLSERAENEAYCAAREGEKYLIYLPGEGEVVVDLSNLAGAATLHWLSLSDGKWLSSTEVTGGEKINLKTPVNNGSMAVIVKE
ncbi:putative collagen-binding domain-containing protein [Cyclobacterium jeungdonense]|uniref:Collagen-binding domain-containing protein n=1 Tax=Cyclobacterium jeungdonense TaxID=708087 RepID=A0ABT8CF65_9BACT|nr:putative collagen-binding domain-containing protein [Cyclobacterium jeungdonense]MDN3690702.1 putative collagen-binding domain-containing protein [Cyclobacterium jeungdonense]